MSFSSIVQVLKVDPVEHVNPPGGTPYERHTAQCMLLDDKGEIQTVGRLVIPKELQGKVEKGIYTAAFSLQTAPWGKSKGDIVAMLTGLVAIPQRQPAKA